jgi:hypothetical protein
VLDKQQVKFVDLPSPIQHPDIIGLARCGVNPLSWLANDVAKLGRCRHDEHEHANHRPVPMSSRGELRRRSPWSALTRRRLAQSTGPKASWLSFKIGSPLALRNLALALPGGSQRDLAPCSPS